MLGDWDRAERHFQAALALNTRLGARTWLAHTAYEYARMLLARDAPSTTGRTRRRSSGSRWASRGRSASSRSDPARWASSAPDVEPQHVLPDGLSAREVEILVELARGARTARSAGILHISEHTAANHIRSILRKTRCANRTEAAGYALRRGLVPD